MAEIKKILFPCDLTEDFSRILPYVLSISEKYNSVIYLLHVIQDLHKWGKLYMPHVSMNQVEKEALKSAEDALDRVCEEHLQGCPGLQRRLASGDPAVEILKMIDSEGIDLVVMGTHGRKGLEHRIFGSIAEKVVKKSPVPVLTINPYKLK
ncbi:MAG: universal stress protein [Deltaproteobacteria bacterium]|nr:universal stress protein [Deltaproteobacteria bacterium]